MTWKLEESKSFLAQSSQVELNRRAGSSATERNDGDVDEEKGRMSTPTIQLTDNQRTAVRLRMVLNFCMMVLFAGCTFVQVSPSAFNVMR